MEERYPIQAARRALRAILWLILVAIATSCSPQGAGTLSVSGGKDKFKNSHKPLPAKKPLAPADPAKHAHGKH
jgi:hypothetical protein